MIKNYLLIPGLMAVLPAISQIGNDHSAPIAAIDIPAVAERAVCDTVVSYGGYNVHVIKDGSGKTRMGLNLFSDEMKNSFDRELLDYVETALLYKCLGVGMATTDNLTVTGGAVTDFRNITPSTPHSVVSSNSRSMAVEWEHNGRNIKVELPVSYQTAGEGSRADIENGFIAGVKNMNSRRQERPSIDTEALEPYRETLFIMPGGSYMNRDITDSVYLDSDGESLTPVWDSAYPAESVANLFIWPSGIYGNQKLNITVLKHQYGEKETFTVTVDQLLAYAEKTGCLPFWGVERFENGRLEGSLFLYNRVQGYDHVFKMSCIPDEVIGGTGEIEARASLFVPTNNVENLYAPYEKKSEDKKIRYDKKK